VLSPAVPSQCPPRFVTTASEVVDRRPAAVRRRVIADLRQRIAAVVPLPSAGQEFDAAEVERCEDVRRLAELLKLRLASVSPRIDETTIDERSGLITINEATDGNRQVPMYRQDSRGRHVVRHYVNVTAEPRY